MKIIFNNNILDDTFTISPLSRGFAYGEGFFTTIKVINNIPENIKYHIKRIEESIKYFNFDIKLPNIEEHIQTILSLNELKNARLKIMFFTETERVSWLMFTNKLEENCDPVKLQTSEYIRGNNPLFSYKTLNYLENIQSSLLIFLDHKNRLLETGFANIFFIKDNTIFTPPTNLPLLPGTYRQYLLDKKMLGNYNFIQKDIYIDELSTFDSVFISNSIKGIIPVTKIDSIVFQTDKVEKIIGLLNEK